MLIRNLEVEKGVVGREIKLYLMNPRDPTIRITFLYQNKNIFKNVIHVYVNNKYKDNVDVEIMAKDLYYKTIVERIEKKSQVYQIIAELFCRVQKRNFEERELDKIPLHQVRAKMQDYYEFKV
jgi:hypothetical protein